MEDKYFSLPHRQLLEIFDTSIITIKDSNPPPAFAVALTVAHNRVAADSNQPHCI